MQWRGLILEEPPFGSRLPLCQVSMISLSFVFSYKLFLRENLLASFYGYYPTIEHAFTSFVSSNTTMNYTCGFSVYCSTYIFYSNISLTIRCSTFKFRNTRRLSCLVIHRHLLNPSMIREWYYLRSGNESSEIVFHWQPLICQSMVYMCKNSWQVLLSSNIKAKYRLYSLDLYIS